MQIYWSVLISKGDLISGHQQEEQIDLESNKSLSVPI